MKIKGTCIGIFMKTESQNKGVNEIRTVKCQNKLHSILLFFEWNFILETWFCGRRNLLVKETLFLDEKIKFLIFQMEIKIFDVENLLKYLRYIRELKKAIVLGAIALPTKYYTLGTRSRAHLTYSLIVPC